MNRLLLPLLSISLTLPALAGSDEVTVVPAHVFSGAPQHGVHVATSGDLALLGGPSGELTEVLVHERVHSGWSLVDSLQPDAWITPTSFGEAVEIDGSTAVVGGRGTVPGVGPCVVAWIFREGGGAWFLEGHAWSADHPSSGDHRIRIAVDGDRLAITAQGSTEAAIWTRSTETWSHEATFSSDMTGKALDLDGDRFLMQDVAMLRIFRRVGSGWQIEQTLSAGIDADLCGDRLVIGGIQWSQAHVYEFVLDEWSFVQDVTVAAGTTVELDGERLVASNWPATGATLFQHDGSEFVPVGTLDGGSDAASPNIGLDLSGDTVILGGSVATGHRIGESLGTSYCQAGVNSMGLQAEVLAIGSAVAAEDGDLISK